MEVEAFKRLYPLPFYERYLDSSVRPDGRPLGRARPTSVSLGAVSTADGSALVKIGNTTMLAGVKLEVMVPSQETPDQGSITVDFQMPPICSPLVRPGRPVEAASVISEQLSNVLTSSELVNLSELCIAPGKAAWMAYLDVYCLDADGSLLDTALLASVAALAHLQLPAVSVSEEGRVYPVSSTTSGDVSMEGAETSIKVKGNSISPRRRLKLGAAPFALTCMVHEKHLLADPCAEEETLLQCSITVTMNQMGRLVSFYKPGGAVPATTAIVKECISLARRRAREVQQILKEALEDHIESPSLMQTD